MQVIGAPYTPPVPLVTPGCCYLCKSTPDQEKDWMIDTQRSISSPGITPIDIGRIYLCAPCATSIASVTDYRRAEVAELETTLAERDDLIVELQEKLSNLTSFIETAKEVVNVFPEKARKSDSGVANARSRARTANADKGV